MKIYLPLISLVLFPFTQILASSLKNVCPNPNSPLLTLPKAKDTCHPRPTRTAGRPKETEILGDENRGELVNDGLKVHRALEEDSDENQQVAQEVGRNCDSYSITVGQRFYWMCMSQLWLFVIQPFIYKVNCQVDRPQYKPVTNLWLHEIFESDNTATTLASTSQPSFVSTTTSTNPTTTLLSPSSSTSSSIFLTFNEFKASILEDLALRKPQPKEIPLHRHRSESSQREGDATAEDDIGSLFEDGGSDEVALVDEIPGRRGKTGLGRVWDWVRDIGAGIGSGLAWDGKYEKLRKPIAEVEGIQGEENGMTTYIPPSPSLLPTLLSSSSQNHASLDCSSSIIASSKGARSSSSILSSSPDKYLLMPCSPSSSSSVSDFTPEEPYGWTIVELCQEILVDSIVMGNFEFFSSGFRTVRVRGLEEDEKAKRGGVLPKWDGDDGGWKDLGVLRAENVRGLQAFAMGGKGFFRYLRFDFLDVSQSNYFGKCNPLMMFWINSQHYGSEYFCPVSAVQVYGLTQMEAWRREEREVKERVEREWEERRREEEQRLATEKQKDAYIGMDNQKDKVSKTDYDGKVSQRMEPEADIIDKIQFEDAPDTHEEFVDSEENSTFLSSASADTPNLASQEGFIGPQPKEFYEKTTSSTLSTPISKTTSKEKEPSFEDVSSSSSQVIESSSRGTKSAFKSESIENSSSRDAELSKNTKASTTSEGSPGKSTTVPTSESDITSSTVPDASSTPSHAIKLSELTVPSPPPVFQFTMPALPPMPTFSPSDGKSAESVFSAITKRLNMLESNTTLLVQYLDTQGRWLMERFEDLEKRVSGSEQAVSDSCHVFIYYEYSLSCTWLYQRVKHEAVLNRLVLELGFKRAEMENERAAVNSKIELLMQEMSFEKRLGIAQLIGMLSLLFFVAVTRGAPYPAVQSPQPRQKTATRVEVFRRLSLRSSAFPSKTAASAARKFNGSRPRSKDSFGLVRASLMRQVRSATPPASFMSPVKRGKERNLEESTVEFPSIDIQTVKDEEDKENIRPENSLKGEGFSTGWERSFSQETLMNAKRENSAEDLNRDLLTPTASATSSYGSEESSRIPSPNSSRRPSASSSTSHRPPPLSLHPLPTGPRRTPSTSPSYPPFVAKPSPSLSRITPVPSPSLYTHKSTSASRVMSPESTDSECSDSDWNSPEPRAESVMPSPFLERKTSQPSALLYSPAMDPLDSVEDSPQKPLRRATSSLTPPVGIMNTRGVNRRASTSQMAPPSGGGRLGISEKISYFSNEESTSTHNPLD